MVSAADILHARILIVDDQQANVLLLERLLRGAGYDSVTSTMNPGEVCELHRKHRYDLIMLDLLMRGMDGFEVMEGMKEIEPEGYLPVLVITAHPDHKLRALQAGAKDFVSKPLDLAEVLARVHNMLEVRLLHLETRKLYDELVAEHKRSIELTAQPGAMVGVVDEERLATHWFRSLRLRHPWLQLDLLTAFAAAAVVGMFQDTIDRLLILTIFLPVLADQSGNTGSQALAITLRGIILGDLQPGKEKALVMKEALLGLMNGALVGLVAAIGMYVVATFEQLHGALMLSLVVFLAMVGSCVISGICGAIVPLVLKRFGTDPVTASSIFLTTATNVASMGMLLGLAAVLVK
jgi:magnesium transporter